MSEPLPETLLLPPGRTMPNSRLPVLIYRHAIGDPASLDKLFTENGWVGVWRDGVYDYHHYHSNAHEVLGVQSGRAQLQLGGEEGEVVDIATGDVLVLPAGTGHCRLRRSEDFVVVGAYPRGQEKYDLLRSRSPEAEWRIAKVAKPETDPVYGVGGPLLKLWS